MLYLLLSVLVSSLLFVIFKLFEVFKVNTFQAIIINYVVAFSFGMKQSKESFSFQEVSNESWFYGAIFLGFLFIVVFNLMGLTAQKNGLSVASVSGKMSVVIPVFFGVLLYDESLGLLKLLGIFLALIAVYLASVKENSSGFNSKTILYPFFLFVGSGLIDTGLKFLEKNYVSENKVAVFVSTIFLFAFFFGVFKVVYLMVKKRFRFHWKNLIAGIALGVPNYYSMEFLVKAFKSDFESSTLFTINNVGIVLVTTFFALLFFKEKLSTKNWGGVLLAIISILLVAFF